MLKPSLRTVPIGCPRPSAREIGKPGTRSRLDDLVPAAWPASVKSVGSLELLSFTTLGFVCSIRLPGSIILEAFDFAKMVGREGIAVVGGFHSPMERQCLEILLVRHVPVVLCPARRLSTERFPRPWRTPLAEGRLLVISPFDETQKRVSRDLAHERNRFVLALSDVLLVPFAAPGGKTEKIVREALGCQKPVWSFGVQEGEDLFALGVRATTARRMMEEVGKTLPGVGGEFRA
jgi:hypothetical protein